MKCGFGEYEFQDLLELFVTLQKSVSFDGTPGLPLVGPAPNASQKGVCMCI